VASSAWTACRPSPAHHSMGPRVASKNTRIRLASFVLLPGFAWGTRPEWDPAQDRRNQPSYLIEPRRARILKAHRQQGNSPAFPRRISAARIETARLAELPPLMAPLAVWLTIPQAEVVEDFHLQVNAPCRAHQKNTASLTKLAASRSPSTKHQLRK
jgi:hypothetical protein